MHWRRAGKWLAITAAVCGGALALSATALVLALRSPDFNRIALPTLAALVDGLTIENLGNARFDVFNSIDVDDVTLRYTNPALGDVRITARGLEVHYALASLLDDQFDVGRIVLRQLRVSGRVVAATDTSEPTDWRGLRTLISDPPWPVTVRETSLGDIVLNLELAEPDQWYRLRGKIDSLSGALRWSPGAMTATGRLTVAPRLATPWQLAVGHGPNSVALEFAPDVVGDVTVDIHSYGDDIQIRSFKLQHTARLRDPVIYAIKGAQRHRSGELKTVAATITATGRSTGRSLFPLALTLDADTQAALDIEDLRYLDVTIAARAAHLLRVKVDGMLDPVTATPSPLRLDLTQSLDIDRFEARSDTLSSVVRDFQWHLTGHGEASPDNAHAGKLNVRIDSNAAGIKIVTGGAQSGDRVTIAATPHFALTAHAEWRTLASLLQQMSLVFEPRLELKNADITHGGAPNARHIRVAAQRLAGTGRYSNGRLSWQGDVDLDGANLPDVPQPLSLRHRIEVDTDLALKRTRLAIHGRMNGRQFISARLDGERAADAYAVRHVITVTPQALRRVPYMVRLFDQAPLARIDMRGNSRWRNRTANAAQFTDVFAAPLHTQGEIHAVLTRPATFGDVRLAGPAALQYKLEYDKGFESGIQLSVNGIASPAFTAPVTLQLSNQSRFTWPHLNLVSNGAAKLENAEVLRYRLDAMDRNQRLTAKAMLSIHTAPDLTRNAPALAPLADLGIVRADVDIAGELNHPQHDSVLALSSTEDIVRARPTFDLNAVITQTQAAKSAPIRLAAPLKINQQVRWSGDHMNAQTRLRSGAIELPSRAGVDGIDVALDVDADLAQTAQEVAAVLRIAQAQVRLPQGGHAADIDVGHLVTPVTLEINVARDAQDLTLRRLIADLGKGVLHFEASGVGNADAKSLQIDSRLHADLTRAHINVAGAAATGQIEVPLRLVMINGEQVSVSAETRFHEVDVKTTEFHLARLDGSVKIEEELQWTGQKRLEFRYLLDADPFQKADFGRIQPYLDDRQGITAQQLSAADLSLGPLYVRPSLKQNLLRVPSFALALFGGYLTGQFYLDTRPGAWRVGLLSRVTGLDPRRLLREDSPLRSSDYSPVSARSALEFDLRERLLEGRVDITEINREQLLQLLELVDPRYEDEQLARLRAALRLAYPRAVSLAMHRGLLDLDVVISTLPAPIKVRGLPLTPFIQRYAGAALVAAERLPLQ